MKHIPALSVAISLLVLTGGCTTPQTKIFKPTYSSFDQPADHPEAETLPAGTINFQGVPVDQVLTIYAELAKRTVVRGPLPSANINFRSTTPLSRINALQMLDTVLAQQGITMILMGDEAVKAVSSSQAPGESPPNIELPWPLLPDSSSYMSRTVYLKNLKAVEVVPVLAPLSKLPNSIMAVQNQNLLIIRDYSSNIKQELRLLEELEKRPAR